MSGALQCEGKQHTGSNRIHTAGNDEKPAIQLIVYLLIGLHEHSDADAISTTATTKKRPASAATT
ncbi:MAG TPA: hypothetical protein VFY56_03435 [Propionibacteriaceae bacterium]|nr:hypothetical protein [Propionibacteriaceae bacterium]